MREIKDALDLITGEKIYFTSHAEATYTRDGKTVEQALAEPKGLQYATERTVYITRGEMRIAGEKIGEYEVEDVTEEQRAYNRETITLDNEVLVLDGQFWGRYSYSDHYSQYSYVAAVSGVCIHGTITIFDTGEAVFVSDLDKFGLTFSEERTLYYPEEGKELTEEEKNYNKETYEILYSGTDVTINVKGQLFAITMSLGDHFSVVAHEANTTAFVELYSDGSIKVLHDMLNIAQSSEQGIKAQLYDLMLYIMMGFSYPSITEGYYNTFNKVDEVECTGQGIILGYNKGQSRVNIIYDFVNDTIDIKEINMNGGSQSDFNLSFSKDF